MSESASWGGGVCSQGGLLQGGCLLQRMSASGGVSNPRGLSAGGVSVPGGVCSWGVSVPGGCLLLGGCLLPEGVSAPWGVCWGGWGLSTTGGLLWGVSALGGIPACTEADNPLLTESQTPVKTLPWPNFVVAGNN